MFMVYICGIELDLETNFPSFSSGNIGILQEETMKNYHILISLVVMHPALKITRHEPGNKAKAEAKSKPEEKTKSAVKAEAKPDVESPPQAEGKPSAKDESKGKP